MSATIWSKSAVPSGWKTIAARPELLRPSSVSSVTPAVLIANRRSGAGCLILRLPVRTSKRPMRPFRLPAREVGADEALEVLLGLEVAANDLDRLGARGVDVDQLEADAAEDGLVLVRAGLAVDAGAEDLDR